MPKDFSPVVALVDMDGTLAGYTEELNRRLALLANPGEAPADQTGYGWDDEPDHIKERMKIIKGNPGFWTALPPLEDGFQILQILDEIGFDIHILTKGPRYAPIGWMEKLVWCEKHLAGIQHQITITMDKGLVYGRVLVDDYPDYTLRWLKWRKRGTVIMPDRPWNQGFVHPQVIRYTGNRVALAEILEEVFNKARSG